MSKKANTSAKLKILDGLFFILIPLPLIGIVVIIVFPQGSGTMAIGTQGLMTGIPEEGCQIVAFLVGFTGSSQILPM
jgi:hypothetical protein